MTGINYEVDLNKVTYPHCAQCAEETASPPRRCPFVGRVSRWDRIRYLLTYWTWPEQEWFQCDEYEGHWHFEGQREHRMPFYERKWPVSQSEAAKYNPSGST